MHSLFLDTGTKSMVVGKEAIQSMKFRSLVVSESYQQKNYRVYFVLVPRSLIPGVSRSSDSYKCEPLSSDTGTGLSHLKGTNAPSLGANSLENSGPWNFPYSFLRPLLLCQTTLGTGLCRIQVGTLLVSSPGDQSVE